MPKKKLNGIKMYYEEEGEGDPLILIMGFGAEGKNWRAQVKNCKKHFRCITFDNRGVGKSSKPRGKYTTHMMAVDTISLMNSLGIFSAHICGLSMGGAIAQQIAIHYPKRVKKLVLASTWAKLDSYAQGAFVICKTAKKRLSREDYFHFLFLWTFAAPYHNKHKKELSRMVKDSAQATNPQPVHALMAQIDACINHDAVRKLSRISVPTLIMAGKEDIFTPVKFSEELKKGIKSSWLELFPGCGHNVFLEDVKAFNKKIIDFLK